jgi:hypothetical protein
MHGVWHDADARRHVGEASGYAVRGELGHDMKGIDPPSEDPEQITPFQRLNRGNAAAMDRGMIETGEIMNGDHQPCTPCGNVGFRRAPHHIALVPVPLGRREVTCQPPGLLMPAIPLESSVLRGLPIRWQTPRSGAEIVLADKKPEPEIGGGRNALKQAVDYATDAGWVDEPPELHV